MEDNLKRALDASTDYLSMKGYELIDVIDGFDVYNDEYDLVFVKTKFVDKSNEIIDIDKFDETDELFGEPLFERKKLELAMVKWLAKNPEEGNCAIRYDEVTVLYLGNNRAILRHSIGVASIGGDE